MSHSNEVNHANKYLFAFIALFVVPISGISIDIYVPSLPAVTHFFQVDRSLAQLSITFYMLGLGIMQLFAGGISDTYGRKKPFLISMFIYIVATIGITFVHDINYLLVLRFIQGVMVAVIIVPMRSVIPDLFEGREMYKMMTYMTMAWSIGPIIAPAIGGYLQHYFSWKANFYFLAGYSVLGFLLVLFYLPETSVHRHPLHIIKLLNRYRDFLNNKEYVSGFMINGLLYSLIILFSVVGPFLIQNVLHYSAVQFGHIALLIGLAWFLGTLVNRFMIDIDLNVKAKVCLWIMLAIALSMFLVSILLPMTIYSIMLPLFGLITLGGILFPNYFARGMSLFPQITGSANALFGSLIFLITGFSSGLATLLKSTSQLPITISYIGIIIVCLGICYFVKVNKARSIALSLG